MGSEIRILKLMLDNKGKPFTIRKISEELDINYRIAYEKAISLEKEKLIKIKKIGNSNLCELGDNFNYKICEAEYLRRDNLLKNKDFLVIYNQLGKINGQFILLLFGSYAKRIENKHSDVDLLLISNEETSKIVEKEIKLFPLKIHLTHLGYEDFASMLKSKEFTVVSEAVKKNIFLFGIEDYYRIIKNAK